MKKISTVLIAALLCGIQISLLSACSSCSARKPEKAAQTEQVMQEEHIFKILPRENKLTEDAEITASYLTLLEAMAEGDENTVLAEAVFLAKAKGDNLMPADHWQECAMWFIERKSVNAVAFLKMACSAWPDSHQLVMLYAEALSSNNFNKEAIDTLNTFLAAHPDIPDVIQQLGIMLQRDNRPAEAATIFATIKEKDRSAYLDYCHAQALMATDNNKEAIEYLKSALKKQPDMAEAMAVQAFLCEKLGDLAEARKIYKKLLKQYPDNKDIYLRLIVLSLKLNDPAWAVKWYEEAPDKDITWRVTAASLFIEARHYLQAERILKDVSKEKDAPAEVFLTLASLSYEQRNNIKEAFEWLNKIPDDSPLAERKHLFMADALSQTGKTEEALKVLHSVAPSPDTVLLETRILATAKQRDKAIECILKGVAQWPDKPVMHYIAGNLLAEAGRMQEAVAAMEKVIALDASNYQALNFVGFSLANENKDLQRAFELITRANTLAPGQFFIIDSLAWVNFRMGNLDEALKDIREARRLDPKNDSEICEHHGDIAAALGLKEEARKAYSKALETGKNKDKAILDKIRKKMEAL